MLRQALRRVASSSLSTSTSSSSTSTSSPAALLLFRASSSSSSSAASAAAKAAGSSNSTPPPPPPRRARWLLFLPPAAAAFLCHWQLERRDWKVKLLEERGRALRAEPLRLEEVLSALREDRGVGGEEEGAKRPMREMTRVVVDGEGSSSFDFDRSSTLLVGPRPRSFGGSTVGGSLVVTPLRRRRRRGGKGGEGEEEGALVVRGWVPSGWRPEDDDDAERKKEKQRQRPSSSPSLLCVLRDSESPSRFVPDNDPSKGLWHWIDAAEMAAAVGLPREGTPLLEVVATADDADDDDDAGGGVFGLRYGEEENSKRRPSLMEVLGGRTAERGSGSPLVDRSSSSSSTSSTAAPSSPPPAPQQPRPQPRPLEETSQVPVSPGQHLQYAATWGTLAATTAALAVKVGRRGGRRGGRA